MEKSEIKRVTFYTTEEGVRVTEVLFSSGVTVVYRNGDLVPRTVTAFMSERKPVTKVVFE